MRTAARVTRWVCEKLALSVAHPFLSKFSHGKKVAREFKNLPKENNRPIGENSPNQVTLTATKCMYAFAQNK
jgi:hypothetical protein